MRKKIKKRVKLKNKNNTKAKVIAIIFGILVILWLIIKIMMVNAYNKIESVDAFFKAYSNKVYYEVNNNYKGNDLFTYKNIKFKNYINNSYEKLKDAKTLSKDGAIVQYYSSSEKAGIYVGYDYSYTDMFAEEITYFSNDKLFIFFSNNQKTRKHILKDNDIYNDLDLLRYMEDVNNTKVTIFTPIYKIEELASVKLFSSVVLPSVEEFVLLDGAYQGYVLINNNVREICIFKDNKKYFITLLGDKFKYEDYEQILSSIVIE